MAQGQNQPRPVGSARGREGARWYNKRPTSEEIADWFSNNVPMHEGMDKSRYVGGLTLIGSKDYADEAEQRQGGVFLRKVVNQVFTPYCKVETRVQYFWDLMSKHPEWIGLIEPVAPMHPQDRTLPPGFFYTNYKVEGRDVTFVCCTHRVRVIEREGAEWVDAPEGWSGGKRSGGGRVLQGTPVIEATPATKQVPVLTTEGWGGNKQVVADAYSMMKAETGATGRALGMAGMLVVPGTGIATAEDMIEAQRQGAPQPGADVDSAPDLGEPLGVPEGAGGAPEEAGEALSAIDALRGEVKEKVERLERESPQKHAAFQEWAREERGFKSLEDLNESQLRGVSRKIDRDFKLG